MGGQDGNRGYLVQAIIALLGSLEDYSWLAITVEPNDVSEKIDVRWVSKHSVRAIQVKSSRNQISKPEVIRWAEELKASCTASDYELVLIGPTNHSVVQLKSHGGVDIPSPKNLDFDGLLNEAAHLLGKFFISEGMNQQTPQARELIVRALITEVLGLSTNGAEWSRNEFVQLLTEWVKSTGIAESSLWERVDFTPQRGIEHAVAGMRLGPLDVDACPAFSIGDEIFKELSRSNIYELAGASGCGKSITAWQIARRFERLGYSIWRPRAFAADHDLIKELPQVKSLLVVDDSHKHTVEFADRLNETCSVERKVLLVSTVENARLSQVICISPDKCIEELSAALLSMEDVLLPIVRRFDDRVGHGTMDMSLRDRIERTRREKKPWEVFWILRGGWLTARREIESVRQFAGGLETLLWIACCQILSCDAGVESDVLAKYMSAQGHSKSTAGKLMDKLTSLGLVLIDDSVRTKHLTFAYQVVEICFHTDNRLEWERLAPIVSLCIRDTKWSLKGIGWILGEGLGTSEAFRFKFPDFRILLDTLVKRCCAEQIDFGWAAGTFSRLVSNFDLPAEQVLQFSENWQTWVASGNPLAAYFCGDVLNALINKSTRDETGYKDVLSKSLVDRMDVNRLLKNINSAEVHDFYSYSHLLDRACFSKPAWAQGFIAGLDWNRLQSLILRSETENSYSIDALVGSLTRLASSKNDESLNYIESIIPFIARAVEEDPSRTIRDMKNVFWWHLRYGPKFLMGGHWPEESHKALARTIVEHIDPRAIASAINNANSRELEGLSWTLDFIRQIDKEFLVKTSAKIDVEAFYKSTSLDWKEQTGELQQFIRCFAFEDGYRPASDWVRTNKGRITGPLKPIFQILAPDVAVEFARAGQGVLLVQKYQNHWSEITGALLAVGRLDRECAEGILRGNLSVLKSELCELTLDPPSQIIRFFKVMHGISAELFNQFVESLDLDDEACVKLIDRLRSNQPVQRLNYQKLARCGLKVKGKLSVLSAELYRKLAD